MYLGKLLQTMFHKFSIIFLLLVLIFELNIKISGADDASGTSHVCVIGAGYSGLGTARYLRQFGVNFTVFEATRYIGETWRFNPYVGTDEDGLPVYSSMYKYLRTNTPRETMEYTGFPLPQNTTSYPSGECFYRYIKSFAKEFDLLKNIKFRSVVTSVKRSEEKWNLTYFRTDTNTSHSEACGFVIVCNGHTYSKPNWPYFKGQEYFKGVMIHSHDYKEPEPYLGRRVLVVGAGPSGMDLATTLTSFAARVIHSHHSTFNDKNYPVNYVKKPDVHSFTQYGVIFIDGSYEKIDDVIFCTGYLQDHPFIDSSAGLIMKPTYRMPLYQHIVNIFHPTMVFVGYPGVYDKQAQYAAALAAKKFKLPSQEEMMMSWFNHLQTLLEMDKDISNINNIPDLGEYLTFLSKESGASIPKPALVKLRKFNVKFRLEDWYHYRDHDYLIIDEENYEIVRSRTNGYNCSINT